MIEDADVQVRETSTRIPNNNKIRITKTKENIIIDFFKCLFVSII